MKRYGRAPYRCLAFLSPVLVSGALTPDRFPIYPAWPYLGTLVRLALAIGLGLFVGLERERRGKEAGVRTFAFAAAIGCVGGLLGDAYALASLALLVPFVLFLNLHALRKDSDTEMTTSAALLVIGFVGVLCGKGHTFTPVALGLATTGLLAWKGKLSGFSLGITEAELRAAILLGILAFVIFPVLPERAIDPWGLIEPRVVWTTVILIAAIGFGNYVLLKLYGSRGVEAAGFLAGLVNSTVAVTELASRARGEASLVGVAFRGTMLATAAMLLRNGVLLAILSPDSLAVAALPLLTMLVASAGLAFGPWSKSNSAGVSPVISLDSPFSLPQALKFGFLFLILSVLGTLAQRVLGSSGFYAVSAAGGFVSSASAVASAGELAAHGKLSATAGGVGAGISAVTSAAVSVPLVSRIARDARLTRWVCFGVGAVIAVGLIGVIAAPAVSSWLRARLGPSASGLRLSHQGGRLPWPFLGIGPATGRTSLAIDSRYRNRILFEPRGRFCEP